MVFTMSESKSVLTLLRFLLFLSRMNPDEFPLSFFLSVLSFFSHREFLFFSKTKTTKLQDLSKHKLVPGTTSFPFAIELPSSLPSSTDYRIGVGEAGFKIQVCIY